jgi:hypothetical protein
MKPSGSFFIAVSGAALCGMWSAIGYGVTTWQYWFMLFFVAVIEVTCLFNRS